MAAFPPHAQAVKVEINDGRGVESQHLAEDQATDNGNAQWPSEFGTRSSAKRERHRAEHRGHCSHQDRTEAQQTRLKNCVSRTLFLVPLRRQSKIDH